MCHTSCQCQKCNYNPPPAPQEFTRDWPHGHQYRCGAAEVYMIASHPTKPGRTVFAEKNGAVFWRPDNGRCMSGAGSPYDVINKPVPKKKVTIYSFAIRKASGAISSISNTDRDVIQRWQNVLGRDTSDIVSVEVEL